MKKPYFFAGTHVVAQQKTLPKWQGIFLRNFYLHFFSVFFALTVFTFFTPTASNNR